MIEACVAFDQAVPRQSRSTLRPIGYRWWSWSAAFVILSRSVRRFSCVGAACVLLPVAIGGAAGSVGDGSSGGVSRRLGLRPEALERGPRLDQRAVDGEMIVRQQRRDLLVRQDRRHQLARDVRRQQPVAVLGEHRRHPHRLVDRRARRTSGTADCIRSCSISWRSERIENRICTRPRATAARARSRGGPRRHRAARNRRRGWPAPDRPRP